MQFTLREEIILGLLYYSKYEKKTFSKNSGTRTDIIKEMNGIATELFVRNFLSRIEIEGYEILKPEKDSNKFYVDKNNLLELLSNHSPLFILHYNMIEDNADVLIDNLKTPSFRTVFPSKNNYTILESVDKQSITPHVMPSD